MTKGSFSFANNSKYLIGSIKFSGLGVFNIFTSFSCSGIFSGLAIFSIEILSPLILNKFFQFLIPSIFNSFSNIF